MVWLCVVVPSDRARRTDRPTVSIMWVETLPLRVAAHTCRASGHLVAVDPSTAQGMVETSDGARHVLALQVVVVTEDDLLVDWDVETSHEFSNELRLVFWSATVLRAGSMDAFVAEGYEVERATVRAGTRTKSSSTVRHMPH